MNEFLENFPNEVLSRYRDVLPEGPVEYADMMHDLFVYLKEAGFLAYPVEYLSFWHAAEEARLWVQKGFCLKFDITRFLVSEGFES